MYSLRNSSNGAKTTNEGPLRNFQCPAFSGPSSVSPLMTAAPHRPQQPPAPAPRRPERNGVGRPRVDPHGLSSALARKYRASLNFLEERELISDTTYAAEFGNGNTHLVSSQSPSWKMRSSRFPSSWTETIEQVTSAVSQAAGEGHERIRVDIRNPEILASKSDFTRGTQDISQLRMALMMDACNETLRMLFKKQKSEFVALDTSLIIRLNRAILYFNSREDADICVPLIAKELRSSVQVLVLGEGNEAAAAESGISVLLCPSNRMGNPAHIESVELVHYSNWNNQNLVIVFNPNLIALTKHLSCNNEPRSPGFLSEYMSCYYVNPLVYSCQKAAGAMLRCFPRKWELYMLRTKSKAGFRLIAEHLERPSPEKVRFEFSWRTDPSSDEVVG